MYASAMYIVEAKLLESLVTKSKPKTVTKKLKDIPDEKPKRSPRIDGIEAQLMLQPMYMLP
jgi:hypothetical protein